MDDTQPKGFPFDAAKADAFAATMVQALNHGMLCLMVSMGHRTGLLDSMRGAPPSTTEEIAGRSHLNERYVREWVGAMVAAGVVQVARDTNRFTLPPEHAAFLTRSAGANNIAVFLQYLGIAGSVEDHIVECFRHGGGLPYSQFPRFHEVQEEDSGAVIVPALDTHIIPLVPGLAEQRAFVADGQASPPKRGDPNFQSPRKSTTVLSNLHGLPNPPKYTRSARGR